MEFFGVLAAIILIGTPILAILAFLRVQHLAEQLQKFPAQNLIARIYALEQRLLALEKTIAPHGVSVARQPTPEASPAAPSAPAAPASLPPALPTAAPPPAPAGEITEQRQTGLPPPQFTVFAAPPLHSAQAKGSSTLDLETRIGGRWLNRIRIVALIG